MTGSSLVRINSGFYVSVDNRYSIQYFTSFRNSGRGWVISFAEGDGYRSAVEHAPTLEAAQARYFELVAA